MSLSDFFKKKKKEVKEDIEAAYISEPIEYIPNMETLEKEVEEEEKLIKEINDSNIFNEDKFDKDSYIDNLEKENEELKEKIKELNGKVVLNSFKTFHLEEENKELNQFKELKRKLGDDGFNKEMEKMNIELGLKQIRDYRLELAKTNRKLNNLEKLLKASKDS